MSSGSPTVPTQRVSLPSIGCGQSPGSADLISRASAVGMGPFSLLRDRFRVFRLVSCANSAGMMPVSRLLASSSSQDAVAAVGGNAVPFTQRRISQPMAAVVPIRAIRHAVDGFQSRPVWMMVHAIWYSRSGFVIVAKLRFCWYRIGLSTSGMATLLRAMG